MGVSGAITGPTASTYAPTIEAMRIYFDRINRMGGINGQKVRFIALDDQGEPSRGATNARRLVAQENFERPGRRRSVRNQHTDDHRSRTQRHPLVFARLGVPAGILSARERDGVLHDLVRRSYDNRAMIDFIAKQYGTNSRSAFAAMAIPASRAGIDIGEARAKELGMTSVGQQVIPPATADFTPFATKLLEGPARLGHSPGRHGSCRSRPSRLCAGSAGRAAS